ncbi:hypothetical protein ACFVX6_15700 [Streptomyces sp. NPDC058289]|uniref:hypothetical protein n=1 Tax=Streptomyces sp. NPDC058289 TaxID=3346425 RepID=UPI0036E9278D
MRWRKALGESVGRIQPDLIIPTGRRKGQNPSLASVYRALGRAREADGGAPAPQDGGGR